VDLAKFSNLILELQLDPRISVACERVGINRNELYKAIEKDPKLREAINRAQDNGGDSLEDEAYRRAVEGWDEPVFNRGVLVGYVRKYSDKLLALMLEGAKPEKYRANRTAVAVVATDKITPDELPKVADRLASILTLARARKDAPECILCGAHHAEGEACK